MYGNRVMQSTQRFWIQDSTAPTTVIYWREPETFSWPSTNASALPRWSPHIESRRDRSLRMGYDAIRAAKVDYPEPLPERLYHRPKRKGRACGSRYRVMLP